VIEHDDQIAGRIFDKRILARIMPFAKPHTGHFVGAIVLLLLTSTIELSIPQLWRWIVNLFVAPGDSAPASRPVLGFGEAMRAVTPLFLLFGCGIVAIGALRYWTSKMLQSGGQLVIYDIRRALFAHLQRQPLAFFDRHAVGRLVTRVINDVENVSELFTSGLVTVIADVIKVFGASLVLLLIDWRVGLIAVALAPPLAIVSMWFRRRARDCFREVRSWLGKSNGYLQEGIAGIRVVQAFGKEEKVARKFGTITAGYLAANIKTVFYFSIFFPLVEIAISADTAGVVAVFGSRVDAGALRAGEYIAIFLYLEFLFTPLRELGEKYNVLQSAMASGERIFKLLDEKTTIETPANPYKPERVQGKLEFNEVNFSYDGKTPVLRDVTFAVQPGQTLALVGATGSGKTTIASLLARFYDITNGNVRVDGVDVRHWDLESLRSSIGFVPQDLFLFAGTVLDNIALWRPGVSRARVKEALVAVGADAFVARLAKPGAADPLDAGLDAAVAERGVTFSVGERQLLAFARALAGSPSLIVLDEATANVDTETEKRIQEGIRTLVHGRTAVVIAHRLSTVREAHAIAVLHKGELREIGTHNDLLRRNGLYAKLVKLQLAKPESAPLSATS
jgi:ATP-binding cassette subfamily B protein